MVIRNCRPRPINELLLEVGKSPSTGGRATRLEKPTHSRRGPEATRIDASHDSRAWQVYTTISTQALEKYPTRVIKSRQVIPKMPLAIV